MGHNDITVEIDVAVRAWIPKRAGPAGQTLPFNPVALNKAVAKQLGVVVKHAGMRYEGKPVRMGIGSAFKSDAWFRKPSYAMDIALGLPLVPNTGSIPR